MNAIIHSMIKNIFDSCFNYGHHNDIIIFVKTLDEYFYNF